MAKAFPENIGNDPELEGSPMARAMQEAFGGDTADDVAERAKEAIGINGDPANEKMIFNATVEGVSRGVEKEKGLNNFKAVKMGLKRDINPKSYEHVISEIERLKNELAQHPEELEFYEKELEKAEKSKQEMELPKNAAEEEPPVGAEVSEKAEVASSEEIEKIPETKESIPEILEEKKEEAAEPALEAEEKPETPEKEKPAEEPKEILDKKPEVVLTEEEEKKIEGAFSEFNISQKELNDLPGFSELSYGQRLLVAENLNQIKLGMIEEKAREAYGEEMKSSGFLGRMWKGISKKYQLAKQEKASLKEIEKGGVEVLGAALENLIKRAGEGPGVEVLEDGEFEMQYAEGFDGITKERQEIIDNFNEVATRFGKMPEEWRFDTASKENQEAYKDLLEEYEEARKGLLDLHETRGTSMGAAIDVNRIDGMVKMNQFLNTHTDVEEELKKINDESAWKRVMMDVVTERGVYAAAGFLTRTATVSLIGALGAPLAAAGLGGFMASKRAKENLREKDMMARRGEKDESETSKNIVDAENLDKKLEYLLERIEKEEDPKNKENLLSQMKERVDYIQGKMEDGLVNYGNESERLNNQYKLTQRLSGLMVAIEEGNVRSREKIERRLEAALKSKKEGISEARKEHIKKQIKRGALIGAGFAGSGYLLRHFGGELFNWLESKNGATKSDILCVSNEEVKEAQDAATSPQHQEMPGAVSGVAPNLPPENLPIEGDDLGVGKVLKDALAVEGSLPHVEAPYTPEIAGGQLNPEDTTASAEVKGVSAPDVNKTTAEAVYEAKSGDSLWKIIGNMDELKDLEGGQKSNAIANIIEAVKKDPEALKALGFESPESIDHLEVGQEMDIAKMKEILGSAEVNGEHIVEHAQNLDEATIKSIEANEARALELSHHEEAVESQQPVSEAVEASKGGSSADTIRSGIAENKIAENIKYNEKLFNGVSGEIEKNGDAVLTFNTKGNALGVKMIITKENKIAVDGYGARNWPDGVKFGGVFTSRKSETFADFNEENLKKALKFINEGNAITEKEKALLGGKAE
ncbi:hypothetical protein HY249_01380 [Candidatus Azambacteria bacterium]|nr:hypothetical protein [Candidatus Azambacteria bacterium]